MNRGGIIRIAQIQQATAAHFGVAVETMRQPDGASGIRQREFAHPRQAAMLLATRLSNLSLVRIGQLFGGRDHSTIIAAIASAQRRSMADPKLHESLRKITFELVRG